MNPQSFVEQIQFSTLRIELLNEHGHVKGIGTGFLLKADLRNIPNSSVILLVSNRHVFEDNKGFIVAFHKKKPESNEPDLGQIFPFYAKDFSGAYFSHSNPKVDLACVNISTVIEQHNSQIYYKYFDQDIFANYCEPELDAGQRIIFIGYPDNRYDKAHNLPIIRSGIIASHPKVDFNNEPHFIIDAQVFPGSSGSPVFLNFKEAQFNRGQIIVGGKQSPYVFLGVVSATMIRNNVVNYIETQMIPMSQEVIGLGLVFKSTALNELIDAVVDNYSLSR